MMKTTQTTAAVPDSFLRPFCGRAPEAKRLPSSIGHRLGTIRGHGIFILAIALLAFGWLAVPTKATILASMVNGLMATETSSSQVTLRWNSSTDTGGPGLAGYQVYRNGTLVGTTTAAVFVDTSVAPNTPYCYTVVAVDLNGLDGFISAEVCVSTPSSATAAMIPSDRLINWTPGYASSVAGVGVPGGVPTTRTNSLLAITVYGADSSGVHDSSGSINAALSHAPANTAVFLPAGTYILSNGLTLANNVTLRGATNTVLVSATSGVPIAHTASDNGVNYGNPSTGRTVTGGLLKGSTNLYVSSTSGLAPGRLLCLARAWYNNTSSSDQYDLPVIINDQGTSSSSFQGWPEQQILMTTGVGSTNIFFWPPLYFDYTGRVCVVNSSASAPPQFAGVEDLSINCSNVDDSNVIQLWEAYGDWIKNVHILQGDGYVVSLLGCLQCEIRDSFIDQSYHNGPNGFGIGLQGSSGILVENNIIFQLFPTIEVFSGSSGNVFGYNFCYNTNGNWAIDSNHGPHNRFNLYEGNIANDFKSDGYFGSESHCVQFRNWFHGQYLADTYVLDRFSRQFSMVGNILGNLKPNSIPNSLTADGTIFGLPNLGNTGSSGYGPPWSTWGSFCNGCQDDYQELDTNVSAAMLGGVTNFIRIGNYSSWSGAIPASESLNGQTLPSSLYLSNQPGWWAAGGFGGAWPPFDPTNPTGTNFTALPAGQRYLSTQ